MSKDPKYGLIPLSLILILFFSMLLIAVPVSATSATPPSSPITVQQGAVFLLRGSITFDKASAGEFSWGPVYWYNYGNENENFTLENTPSVYWVNCTSNPALNGTPVENVNIYDPSIPEDEWYYALPNGWQIEIKDNGGGNLVIWPNGTFYVDIWLRAQGKGGVLHAPENQDIYFSMDQITVWEPGTVTVPAGPITVQVLGRGVDISISPGSQENLSGENLAYTVTVKNTGNMGKDNYNLTVSDNAGWGDNITLDNTRLENIPESENRTTTLHVHIENAVIPCTRDNITVTATSQGDNTKKDNASCIAHAALGGVDVSISSLDNGGAWPGENATFTVTVTNRGRSRDNYNLTVSDNAGWGPRIDNDNLYDIPESENRTTTLRVRIPENARTRLEDNITVIATSWTDNTVNDNASCIAHAIIIRGVEVSISPAENAGLRGWTLTYTVTVWNRGSIKDNFRLENSDNLTWPNALDNVQFDNVLPGENRMTTLRVTIPESAAPCTRDNVSVVAILVENEDVRAENKCVAHLARVTFEVSISPSFQSRFRGDNLTYTVTVSNTTENVDFQDNYYLTIGDNSSWPLSLLENKIENVGQSDNKSKTFTVTIPDNATPCTGDNITVTATSQTDDNENRSGSCIAHSLAVHMSITPEYQSGIRGDNLTYTVKVWSTSSENDNFRLTVSDNSGWPLSLQENIEVSAIENGTATLTVTIPGGVALDTRDNITVTVTSWKDNTVKDNTRCIAQAGYTEVSMSISPQYKEGARGERLAYTVTVNNLGTIIDNFRLTVKDNADNYPSWNPKIEIPKIYPAADACIRENLPDNNFGEDNYFDVGRKDAGAVRSFLRFDLSSIPAGSTIKNVKLYVYAENTYAGVKENVRCFSIDNDNWVENKITWDNKPGVGENLDNQGVTSPGWYSWTVTSFVEQQFVGDDNASFCMVSENENVGGEHWARFRSREFGGTGSDPYLEVEVGAFVLSPSENKTTTLYVPVSWYSPEGTTDNITVTVKSAENENVLAENSCIAFSKGEAGENITPIDDSYVWGKYPDNNFNSDDYFYIGRMDNYPKRIFLKFDLSGISLLAGSKFAGGTLRLTTYRDYDNHMANVRCYRVDNDNWSENTITWNNSPKIGEAISDNMEVTKSYTLYEWNITPFLMEQFENDKIVSVCMIDIGENDPPDHYAIFYSRRQAPTLWPYLYTTYSMGRWSMQVSTSPSYQSRPHGENLTYDVIVKNLGWENRNYNLSVTDNAGWGPTLENLLENVPPGENGTVTLRVKIPENAVPCTEDNITITVTPQDNTGASKSISCTAHSMALHVSIYPPPVTSVVPGDHLTYTVNVWSTSTSSENDNFRLTVRDNSGWGLSISPENTGVSAVENGTTTLTVTIPENANFCTRDNITVIATSWADNTVKDNSSCIAHAGKVDLMVSVSQKYQSEFPGQKLYYDVTITNTGTVIENFEFVKVIGNENWTWNKPDPFRNVLPGEDRTYKLTITVPSGAVHCTTDNITVIWKATVAQALLTKVVYPSDDAYVEYDKPNTTFNTEELSISPTTAGFYAKIPWLKFNLSLPEGAESLASAELSPYFFYVQEAGSGALTGAYFSENDNWSENTITWNNMPSRAQTPTDSILLYNAIGLKQWDVTSDVLQELKGDNKASWCLKNEGTENNWDAASAYSKDYYNENLWPYLEIVGENMKRGVAYDNDNCTAHAIHLKVSIKEITPTSYEGLPGSSFEFVIKVKNDGIENDNYHLTVVDDAGWENLRFDDNFFEVGVGEAYTTYLLVKIPDNATPGMRDNLKVIATSGKDPNTSDNDNCTVLVKSFTRSVRVSISPSYQENVPGGSTTFTATVTNTGDVTDNFTLSARDNENWSLSVFPSSLLIAKGASGNATLTVRIPDNAAAYRRDNIRVIAQSRYDNTVENENSCILQVTAIRRGVRVEISPTENSSEPGENVAFRVIVTNTGNVADNYNLKVSDNSVWTLTLSENSISNVDNVASRTVTLTATIPENAKNGTRDNITVTARSMIDNTIENSASCTAHAIVTIGMGVEVTISPSEKTGLPGESLSFTVTIKNTGDADDSYDLTVNDDAGWGATLSENMLTIPAGGNITVVVSVTIPSDAIDGDSTAITVTAISRGDPTKSGGATCTATAKTVAGGISPWVYVGAVVVIVVIIAAVLVIRPF